MALALDVLHDLVIGGEFLSVLSEDTVNTIDGGISDEFLELWHVDEVGYISVEHHVVSHAEISVVILVVLAFADSIGQTPGGAALAIWLLDLFLLRLVDKLVPTHIDKGLLIEERLLVITDHLLCGGLDAETVVWLDELCANW